MSKELLATYLNDHLAGANAAVELLNHLISENHSSRAALSALQTEIQQDREQLKSLMAKQHIGESSVKKVGARIAELVADMKLRMDDAQQGPLRRLERLEALAIGIDGKIALWASLEQASRLNDKLREFNFTHLTARGRDQRSRVETLRLEAAHEALAA